MCFEPGYAIFCSSQTVWIEIHERHFGVFVELGVGEEIAGADTDIEVGRAVLDVLSEKGEERVGGGAAPDPSVGYAEDPDVVGEAEEGGGRVDGGAGGRGGGGHGGGWLGVGRSDKEMESLSRELLATRFEI